MVVVLSGSSLRTRPDYLLDASSSKMIFYERFPGRIVDIIDETSRINVVIGIDMVIASSIVNGKRIDFKRYYWKW